MKVKRKIIEIDAVMIQDHSVEGGNPDQCFGLEPMDRIKNGIQVHLGHEHDCSALQKGAQGTGLA